MSASDDILSILPSVLLQNAFLAGSEAAWARDDALAVVDRLAEMSIAIYGVEIWIPTVQGPYIPSPLFYQFTTEEPPENETWEGFVRRSAEAVKAYITRFEWDEHDDSHRTLTPYFNLTVGASGQRP